MRPRLMFTGYLRGNPKLAPLTQDHVHKIGSTLDSISDPTLRQAAETFINSCRAPSDLTASQQLALLMLARSDVAKACVTQLQASTVRAGYADFKVLVDRSWAYHDGRYHKITPRGKWAADALAKIVARQLGLHLFITTGGRFTSGFYCTCGGYSYSHSRNEGHERSAFARRMGEHLEAVGQATETARA